MTRLYKRTLILCIIALLVFAVTVIIDGTMNAPGIPYKIISYLLATVLAFAIWIFMALRQNLLKVYTSIQKRSEELWRVLEKNLNLILLILTIVHLVVFALICVSLWMVLYRIFSGAPIFG